ncbi:MAG: sensor histidine kinase [Candidatus Saccharimonadales bacterium]
MPTKQTELAEAEIEHRRLLSLINSMADGVVALDKSLKIVLYNASALSILDINLTITDKHIGDILKIYNNEGQPVDAEEIIGNSKIVTITRDYLLHYSDNSKANLYLSISPVHLGYGQKGQRGYVLVLRDITREKSLEEERDEFISVVSHELRTPIAITEGNISNAQFIAQKTGDLAVVKQALESAHKQALFLADMINDLSTLSRAERGKLMLDVGAINVHKLLISLEENYSDEAKTKGLEIKIEPDPHLEILNSGELYVREILQNFITNSLKYTEKGSITIGAKPKSSGVEFWVSDTGIGISKPDQEKIFDKFFRSEDYRTRSSKGTGLGLYITIKLVHILRAEIDVASQLDHGSTFKIYVPNLVS